MTGKTVEEAKEAALFQLGVAEGDAELIVVSEPKSGLFGRVRGEARVRAPVRPVGPRPKRQRHGKSDRTRSSGGSRSTKQGSGRGGQTAKPANGEGDGADGGSQTKPAGAGGGKSRSARRRRSRSGSRSGAKGAAVAAGVNGSARGRDEERPGDGRQGRGRGGPEGQKAKEEAEMAEGMTLEEQGAVAKEFLEGLLDSYGFEGTVETRLIDEETVEVAAHGEGLGVLVGPKGSTLAALQDVTRTVVQRRCPSRTDRILVDVAGYREKRTAALQRFSEQVAADVIETGSERALEPMSPADRKVVHDTVTGIEGVDTRSEGDDPYRHVVIAPA